MWSQEPLGVEGRGNCPPIIRSCPYQIPVLSSTVWWSLLLDIRCMWRHYTTSYLCLPTNVLAKFVHTTCIFRDAGGAVGKQSHRHGGPFVSLAPPSKQSSRPSQIELWSTTDQWSFYQISECQAPMNRRKALLLKTFSRPFCREGGAVKQLRAMET